MRTNYAIYFHKLGKYYSKNSKQELFYLIRQQDMINVCVIITDVGLFIFIAILFQYNYKLYTSHRKCSRIAKSIKLKHEKLPQNIETVNFV